MEFTVLINAEAFSVSSGDDSLYLVCGGSDMYIIFKEDKWCCAEPIEDSLLDAIGQEIDLRRNNPRHLC